MRQAFVNLFHSNLAYHLNFNKELDKTPLSDVLCIGLMTIQQHCIVANLTEVRDV